MYNLLVFSMVGENKSPSPHQNMARRLNSLRAFFFHRPNIGQIPRLKKKFQAHLTSTIQFGYICSQMSEARFYEQAIFTRKDLVDLSGLSVPSVKQYLMRQVVPSSDLPKGSDPGKIGRFAMPTVMRIIIMARLSKDFGITPIASSLIAQNLSWNCVSMLQQEIWRNTPGCTMRHWTSAPNGKVETFPRTAGQLPDTFSAFWTNWGDFHTTEGIVASTWEALSYFDGEKHVINHIAASKFATAVVPDRHLWLHVIWPVVRRFELKTKEPLPLPDELRRALLLAEREP